MEKAGWSNTSTFFKFYNKPIKEKRAITFEDAVLQTQDKIEVTKVFITFFCSFLTIGFKVVQVLL
jgi:hypothetical protein